VKPSLHTPSLSLCALLMLAGCSEGDQLKRALNGMEADCAVPLRVELRYSWWSKEGTFTCAEVKRGAFK
jgi:hypothetical protein